MIREIFIGYDPREAEAFAVARRSIRKHGGSKVIVRGLLLSDLMRTGIYWRPTEVDQRFRLIDVLSRTESYNGEMATQFAISRFFVPFLAGNATQWAYFVDCDIMVRADLDELFQLVESQADKAVCCVKHFHQPAAGSKMDNRAQTSYPRKNWSSVMAFNVGHVGNEALTLDLLNTVPGRDLHRFCWLSDELIGNLPVEWNWLAQVSDPCIVPNLVHWTLGGPWLPAFNDAPYADEYRHYRDDWVRREGGLVPVASGIARKPGLPWLGAK